MYQARGKDMFKLVKWAGICFIGFVLLGTVQIMRKAVREQAARPVERASVSVPERPKIDPAKRAERQRFVDKMQSQGIFGDVSVRNRVGRLVVGRKFASIDFKAKQMFASVAYGWCLDHDADCMMLVLHDPQTDKKIGRYSAVDGRLQMY